MLRRHITATDPPSSLQLIASALSTSSLLGLCLADLAAFPRDKSSPTADHSTSRDRHGVTRRLLETLQWRISHATRDSRTDEKLGEGRILGDLAQQSCKARSSRGDGSHCRADLIVWRGGDRIMWARGLRHRGTLFRQFPVEVCGDKCSGHTASPHVTRRTENE